MKNVKIIDPKKWFELHKVDESITAIREPHHFEDVLSFQVDVGNGKSILIDGGMGIANIIKVRNSPEGVKAIIFTHAHEDHVGILNNLQQLNHPTIYIYDDASEIGLLQNGFVKPYTSHGVTQEFASFDIDSVSIIGASTYTTVSNNQKIRFGNRTLQVIHTPGHTPGSICLWDEEHGKLFTGDTLYNGPIFLHLEESNFGEYKKSIVELITITKGKLKTIYPGHNHTTLTPDFLSRVGHYINNLGDADEITEGEDEFGQFIRYSFEDRFQLILKN